MPTIHPTAIVDRAAEIAPDAAVGPYCVINGRATLESGVRLISNVCIEASQGPVHVGARTVIHPFACIGFAPQDVKHDHTKPAPGVRIGVDCTLREHVTVHSASVGKDRPTIVGDRNFLMVNAHLGHDAMTGNDVIMVNNTALGGHAVIGDKATLGGGALVHQFCRVGRFAFISGGSEITADIPPFCTVWGRNRLAGLNLVGLRRNNFSREDITIIRRAFREAFRTYLTRPQQLELLRELGASSPLVNEIADFVEATKRTIAMYHSQVRGEDDADAE